ncbi:MAG TPA: bifunctional serine/threonine-protein kinase/formylglycine-generating enzyme family protein [Rhodanobacter sp.]|nr:bifunctional serine/threonine-protein kinase/formylglycine-generating enzyme family protein [Rhodanobacter sp.]
MNSLAELIAAYQAGTLKLLALFNAVAARGPQAEEDHRAEIALVETMEAEGTLEADIARALVAKLVKLQAPPAAAEVEANDDATVIKPASQNRPVAEDATVVQPASRPTATPPHDDATVVKPASWRPPEDNQSTGTQGRTGTGTHSNSTFNADTWQRVADAEGGDYATVGMLLKGRFLLEREIGRGGMGVVFLARDERKVEARDRDPYVAVKVLNDEFRRHPDSLISLQRESRRSQSLAHDNIVRVYDFDKDRTIVFMTMEYIDGSDLKTLIRERAYNGLPLAEVRPLIEGMAWALKRAHAAGVVHSDFKPGNVMVTRDGVPKVFDFGIARAGKHMGDAVGEQTVFDAGTLGALTPAYASLEMIRGAEPEPTDDIYALGCVVFELLTGKHPFDKVSAEVALKEGRKPPPVPGLSRRQYKTLCDAIAFHSEQRLKSASDLIEGLREVGWRERLGPYLAYGGAAAVLLAAGGWGFGRYLHEQQVRGVIAGFTVTDPHHYLNEDQALKAFDRLGDDDRLRIVADQGDAIQNFLLSRVDAYWDPDQGRYAYARALHVFALRDKLKLYSPTLDLKRNAIEEQKNALLNTLDTQLTQRIDKGAIFEDQPDSAVATLKQIRAIDPDSSLLKNGELELKYDSAIGQSLAAGRLDEAGARLKLASQLFPASARLQRREAQLASLSQAAIAAAAPMTSHVAQTVPQARQALADLLAKPTMDGKWQAAVADAMLTLKGDSAAETTRLVTALADAIATETGRQSDPLHLARAGELVAYGLRYAPDSKSLLAQRDRIDALLHQQQAQLDQESVAAEVTSRIESLKRAAAAGDTAKAQESLARVQALQPDNAFLKHDGPQLVADAYLGKAREAFRKGRDTTTASVLAQATQALGDRSDLRHASTRYALASALIKARGKVVAAADYQRLGGQLADLRRVDADGLAQLESDMKLRGQLPEGSLSRALDALKTGASAPSPIAPPPGPAVVAAPTPAPAAATPVAPTRNGARPAVATVKPAAPGQATVAQGSALASADPCGQPALVGQGRSCFDPIAGKRGPSLVVVSGVGGGRPYAISRTEVTVNEFNRFCAATGKCTATAVADRESGVLPVSNITLAQARAYAAWLGSASGYVYRLPTDAEWMHAAQAGSGWKQAPDSNCVPPGAIGGDGSGGPISARGREPNPWGLVNLTGNVWEWVSSGGSAMVRGGSYTSYWSDCTVASHRQDSGAAAKDVGFRIVRELK